MSAAPRPHSENPGYVTWPLAYTPRDDSFPHGWVARGEAQSKKTDGIDNFIAIRRSRLPCLWQ